LAVCYLHAVPSPIHGKAQHGPAIIVENANGEGASCITALAEQFTHVRKRILSNRIYCLATVNTPAEDIVVQAATRFTSASEVAIVSP
jgi:hypothetical protein